MHKSRTDRHDLARSHKGIPEQQSQHQQLSLTSTQPKFGSRYGTDVSPRLPQRQSSEALDVTSLSPTTDPRRLSGSPLRTFPNSPLLLDTEDWSFLHAYLQSSSENSPALPRSPWTGRRPSSAGTLHEPSARSPLSRSHERDSWPDNIEDYALGNTPISPATARPGSAALDTIIEGASLDHDVSLAETSVFGFDRYRFSSVSTRSEPTGTSPRSSPVPATQSGILTDRTSRASSVLSDASSHGGTGGFRPKPLILRRNSRSADPAAQASSRLSRSFSVPMLMLEMTPTDDDSQLERQGRTRSETAGSPSSGREYLTPTPTFGVGTASKPSDASTHEQQTGTAFREAASPAVIQSPLNRAPNEPGSSTTPHTSHVDYATPRKHAPSTIKISGASNSALVIAEHADVGDSSEEPSLPANMGSSTLSPAAAATNTTPRKSQSSSDTDPDQSLRSDSLSPPRSAASAETRSSGTIELVPWQVATTDSTGPRRSEEIFRPLSMALSMSRSGAGSSRDTSTSRTARQAAMADVGSRRSTIKMPGTPLKGGTDFIWGRPESVARSSRETAELAAASASAASSRRPSHIGLGFSVPRPSVGSEQMHGPYPDFYPAATDVKPEVREGGHQSNRSGSRNSTARDYRISSPPGAMKRLLFELEHGSNDSQLARAAAQQQATPPDGFYDSSGTGTIEQDKQHQRSVTLSSISILPRTSSMRRRNQSVDMDERRSSARASGLGAVAGLETLIEHPFVPDHASAPPRQRKADDELRHRTEDEATGDNANILKSIFKRAARREVESRGLRIALQLHIIVYQTLFFTFESPYVWNSISIALPLVAAALFLILDMLILQMYLLKGEQHKLYLFFLSLSAFALAYCSAMCALKIVLLTRTADLGASSPGIHLHRNRTPDGNAFQQVLRDVPWSAVLFLLGVIGTLISSILSVSMVMMHRRRREEHHS